MTSAVPAVVTAKPVRTARIANASAVLAFVAFVVSAVFLKSGQGRVVDTDQVFLVIVGLIVAGGLRLPARPRLRADTQAVQMRGYLGNYRTVPWSVIAALEFPSNARFARIVLPGDDYLALYAVQRADRELAVQTMRSLRALYASTHPVG